MPNNSITKRTDGVAKKIKIGTVKVQGKNNTVKLQSKVGPKIKINTVKGAYKSSHVRMKIRGGLPKVKVRKNEQV